ncbi:MAG TPA: hypothetical protein VK973_03130 [Arenicellales bacterium]|nr:hypothetical protein [Arenicellales bacterium]
MFRSIGHIVRGIYTRWRSGIDMTNIEHQRADLRFRLAMVEYAYFGRSGRRVARCLAELRSILGDKAVHRYLRTLDPELRTQFVERFQGSRRHDEADFTSRRANAKPGSGDQAAMDTPQFMAAMSAPNVVPFDSTARRTGTDVTDGTHTALDGSRDKPGSRSMDRGD